MAKSGAIKKVVSTGDVGFNMTPMIDCTFQLIIFFILATQFASEAYAKDVEIARPTESQALAVDINNPRNRVVINVVSMDPRGESDDAWAASQAQGYVINGQKYDVGDISSIIELIKVEKDEAEKAGLVSDQEGKEFFVEIRADKRVNWHDVAPVIRASVEAGIRKMNLTALKAYDE
jgi:biopolymer transport protein ExbD